MYCLTWLLDVPAQSYHPLLPSALPVRYPRSILPSDIPVHSYHSYVTFRNSPSGIDVSYYRPVSPPNLAVRYCRPLLPSNIALQACRPTLAQAIAVRYPRPILPSSCSSAPYSSLFHLWSFPSLLLHSTFLQLYLSASFVFGFFRRTHVKMAYDGVC